MTLRDELRAFADRIADALERAGSGDDWVDQKKSPLGRAKHLALVKSGALPGVKEGRQVLVRRSDIDAYLAKHKVVHIDPAADEDREAERIAASMGSRRK